ncbi:MAG: Crp/Fnr family transcriptional regulator [Bacteroidota bacterium]|nr:Crp/Fnr family transcriptional regulator [Bacteroidota bacterium]
MDTAEALDRIFLFDTLDNAQRRMVAECVTVCTPEKGSHLYFEGDAAHAFYAVLEGQFKVYRVTPGGDEFIVHIQQEGDVIAEAAMFDVKTYPASCIAMTDGSVLRIDSRSFVALLLAEPLLSLRILHAYSRRLRSFVSALEDLSRRDVKARLANYLLRNAEDSAGILFCPVPFSKRELATLLGTIPETLSRTLREFKSHGVIEERRNGFLLPDAHALRAYCSE